MGLNAARRIVWLKSGPLPDRPIDNSVVQAMIRTMELAQLGVRAGL
jgi:hypothetical protein